MAFSFSVGGVTCAALGTTDGRKAMAFLPDAPEYAINRYHVPGSNGNFIQRLGKDGGKIRVRIRYIGQHSTALGLYNSDCLAWANSAVTLAGPNRSFNNCNLDKGAGRIIKEAVAMGRGTVGQVYFDAEFCFTHDGVD